VEAWLERLTLMEAKLASQINALRADVAVIDREVQRLRVKSGYWALFGVLLGALGVVLLKVGGG
jgi:hypothetical protein